MAQNFETAVGTKAVGEAYDKTFAMITLSVNFDIVEVVPVNEEWAFARTLKPFPQKDQNTQSYNLMLIREMLMRNRHRFSRKGSFEIRGRERRSESGTVCAAEGRWEVEDCEVLLQQYFASPLDFAVSVSSSLEVRKLQEAKSLKIGDDCREDRRRLGRCIPRERDSHMPFSSPFCFVFLNNS